MKLFQYHVEMENAPLANWKIILPIFKEKRDGYPYRPVFDSSPGTPGSKFVDDLNWFLTTRNIGNIKQLHLGGWVQTKLEFELRSKILPAVQASLQELTISGDWYLSQEDAKECEFPKTLHFFNLRSFTIDVGNETCSDLGWVGNLVRGITNVYSITLSCDDAPLARSFLDNVHQLSSSFVRLENLVISCPNPDVIKQLLQIKLNRPLKSFRVFDTFLGFETRVDWNLFGQLLSKYSSTLEKLALTIPELEWHTKREEFIKFPGFPNLKYLDISWNDDKMQVDLVFPEGSINYEKDFPSLKSLAIGPSNNFGSLYGSVCEAFHQLMKKIEK